MNDEDGDNVFLVEGGCVTVEEFKGAPVPTKIALSDSIIQSALRHIQALGCELRWIENKDHRRILTSEKLKCFQVGEVRIMSDTKITGQAWLLDAARKVGKPVFTTVDIRRCIEGMDISEEDKERACGALYIAVTELVTKQKMKRVTGGLSLVE